MKVDWTEKLLCACDAECEELLIDRGSRTEESDKDAEEGMTIWDCAKDKRLSNAVTKVFKSTVGSDTDAAGPAPTMPCWDVLLLAIFGTKNIHVLSCLSINTRGQKYFGISHHPTCCASPFLEPIQIYCSKVT